jgi:taurine transport system substrate-binding protein
VFHRNPLETTVPIAPRRTLVLVALATLAPLALACGSGTTTSTPGGTSAGGAGARPEKITIAYQEVPNGDLVVKHQGWLEQELAGVEVEWKKFDSGGDVNEAVAARAVDIGLAGSSPVSRGLSQPLPYQVPWIFDVIGKAEALVVKGDRGITSLADLKGKTIATPLASTAHYSLLAALQDAGVEEGSVKVIDATPADIYAAWTRGDIDGAYVWNPNLAKLKAEGGKVIVDSEQLARKGKTTYDLAVVTNDFADRYPAVVTAWVRQQDRAVKLIRSDPAQAATAVAAELNITPDEAKAQLADLIFLDAKEQTGPDYLGRGLADNLYASAQFNKSLGKIDAVQPEGDYRKAVVTTFAQL